MAHKMTFITRPLKMEGGGKVGCFWLSREKTKLTVTTWPRVVSIPHGEFFHFHSRLFCFRHNLGHQLFADAEDEAEASGPAPEEGQPAPEDHRVHHQPQDHQTTGWLICFHSMTWCTNPSATSSLPLQLNGACWFTVSCSHKQTLG